MHGALTAVDEVWHALHAQISALRGDDWDAPTACSEWTVRDLVSHLGAVEGGFQGFEQPEPPAGWTSSHEGIDAWTERGVVARRGWTTEAIVDEVRRAASAQVARLAALDGDGWKAETVGPVGKTTMEGLAAIRVFDLYTHLLDLRWGLQRPLDPGSAPHALALAAGRAVDLSGWAAVKKAGLADGVRVRIDLAGPGGLTADLVVDGGRARLDAPSEPAPPDKIEGTAAAYMLVAAGRTALADGAGGVTATGPAATALLNRYRMF
jgi:uncharacterized protein (TIGR03083 family)